MLNSNKPIKFACLSKIIYNQSILNGTYVVEMGKTFAVVFMKAKISLALLWRQKHVS